MRAAGRSRRAAQLPRRRLSPRAAARSRSMAAVADRPRAAPLRRRGVRVAGAVLRLWSARWFIDGGMTRGIPDAAARARTITVYADPRKVVDNLGLAGTDTIAVLL